MNERLKASLPGIFSIAFLALFLVSQFVAGVPFEVVDFAKVILIAVAAWLGLSWIPPQLPAQPGDQSLKGNLGGIFTIVVLGLHVGDQFSGFIQPVWVEMLGDALLLVATWLGLPWTKPQLPSQAPMLLVLFLAGAVFIIGPSGALILLA